MTLTPSSTISDAWKLESGKPGPTLCLLGGIHGNEPAGTQLIRSIVNDQRTLPLTRGSVVLALGNPAAIEKNLRFCEADLNRSFLPKENPSNTLEARRAEELKTLLDASDVLLDIHSSFAATSQPFLICEANAAGIARQLPVPLLCSGFDALHPGGTDGTMNAIGKIGICYETGPADDAAGIDRAWKIVQATLGALGMLDCSPALLQEQKSLQAETLYRSRTDRFVLSRPYADFEDLSDNEIIGYDGTEPVKGKAGDVILFARNAEQPATECFVLARNI